MSESKVPFDHVHGAARKNTIINGDMRIAQRGTSFAAIANAAYSLDRWLYQKVGVMVHTITQDSDTPNDQFAYSLKLDCTTADTSIAATDFNVLTQRIEGYNFKRFVGKTATYSFWIKAGKTGTMCVSFRNTSGTQRSYVSEVTIDSANTWEKKEVTLDFDYSGGTWDYVNGVGLEINFALLGGSTYAVTADSWEAQTAFVTSNQTNFVDATDTTTDIYITGVQLELGDEASDFEFLDYQQQLSMCYRYYWRHVAGADSASFALASNNSTTLARGTYRYPVVMRTVPTITYNGSFQVLDAAAGVVASTSQTAIQIAPTTAMLDFSTAGSLTDGHASSLRSSTDAAAYIAFDAEL